VQVQVRPAGPLSPWQGTSVEHAVIIIITIIIIIIISLGYNGTDDSQI